MKASVLSGGVLKNASHSGSREAVAGHHFNLANPLVT